jgi:hypothetical protein
MFRNAPYASDRCDAEGLAPQFYGWLSWLTSG